MQSTKRLIAILLLTATVSLTAAAQQPTATTLNPEPVNTDAAVPASPALQGSKEADEKMAWLKNYAIDQRAKKKEEKAGDKKKASQYEVESWRLWLVLAILAAMVGGLIVILRKYGRGILPSSNASVITIKSKVQIDPRNSVALLKIYDEEYVVGSGTNGVTLLAKLLPIDGTQSELENEPEGGLNEPKIEKKFIEEFKLAESRIESQEVK